ncbi:MAG: VWA domain-containing protein [Thermodesulfobacteriota bacterium]
MNSIHFGQPAWMGVGLAACIAILLILRLMEKRRKKNLVRFVGPQLLGRLTVNISQGKRRIKQTLLILGIFCCFIALARPQYGYQWIDVKRKGIDILFGVDTSKSMLAQDIRPTRLARAKLAVMDFVQRLEGDRVGLLPFAGSSFLLCPMTIDYQAFGNGLEILNPGVIPSGGTDITGVITRAESILANDANHKILVLLTDGENLEGDAIAAARKAAEKGLIIHTVGVGTSDGELIPAGTDGTGFIKDSSGKFVTSRLDEKTLREIAEVTGGLYAPLGAQGEGLERIYQEKLALIPKEELMEKRHKLPLERFPWPLGAAVFLLTLEFFLADRKSSRSFRVPFIKTAGRRRPKKTAAALFLFFAASSMNTSPCQASQGEDAYRTQDYLTASQYYADELEKEPKDPRLHYNYGTAAYKNGLFDDAAASFRASLASEDLTLQGKAYYNLGNSLYQQGKESLRADQSHTVKLWEEALEAYRGSLALDQNNSSAAFNRDLVTQKLEELKKQEQQQEQKEKQSSDQSQCDNPQEGDGQKSDKEQEKQENKEKQDSQSSSDQKEDEQKKGDKEQDRQADSPQDNDSQNKEQKGGEQKSDAQQDTGEQQKEDQQQEAGEDKKAGSPEQEQNSQKEQEGGAADQQAQPAAPVRPGEMSQEEARRLLKAIVAEEDDLNFIPGLKRGSASDTPSSGKDW